MTTEANNNTTTEAFSAVMLNVLHEYFPADAWILLRSDENTKGWLMLMGCPSLGFQALYSLLPTSLTILSRADYSQSEIAHLIAKDFNKAYLADKTNA